MSTPLALSRTDLTHWQWRFLALGLVALVTCAMGAIFDPAQFFRAYLASWLFFAGISLGSMAILMIYHLTGGAWGFLIRRIVEAAMRTLPLIAALFVPIACGIGYIYIWAQSDAVAVDKHLQYKQFYLNGPFFWARSAAYFVGWLTLAHYLSRWSGEEDRGGNRGLQAKVVRLSGLGLVFYGISLHFAVVDWVTSLEPTFHSTISGPLMASGQLLSAQALAVVVLAALAHAPLSAVISAKVLNDLGNLLLALLIVWAYMFWFEFMLVWIANLRVDVVWYLPRTTRIWRWIAMLIAVLHFVVPFFLLLFRRVKQNVKIVGPVAGLILGMQLVFNFYQVMPAFGAASIRQHWMDFLVPLGLAGVWLAFFLWQFLRWPLLARNDPNQRQAARLRQLDQEEAVREEALAHG